jgi:coenzyme F420 hydrogenase subunit beta
LGFKYFWDIFINRLKESENVMSQLLTFGDLASLVVKPNLCVRCGACVAVCPPDVLKVDEYTSEGAQLVGVCTLCGLCPLVCPVLHPYEAPLDKPLGDYIEYGIYKAADPELKATDGGVTTVLLEEAFEMGLIDGAIVASKDDEWYAKAVIVTDKKELRKYAQTIYWHVPMVTPLRIAIEKMKLKKVAIVGTGCQTAAAKLMDKIPKFKGRVALLLGLFCSKTWMREDFYDKVKEKLALEPKDIEDIIVKNKLIFKLKNGETRELPLEEVEDTTFGSCYVCHDFTAEVSDISLGANGAPPGWNFLLIRSQVGKQLVENALKSGKLLKSNEKPKVKFVIRRAIDQKLRTIPEFMAKQLPIAISK